MKISLNWIKEFTDIKVPNDELIRKIGAQLGAVEEVIPLGTRYQGIVVAKVVSCMPHPNADKLQVCKIDDGQAVKGVERDENGLVQVVCGAPNVREGLLVAWLAPGVVVPSTYDKEQFELGTREIRGILSNGMLGSGRELAINDDHDGILEVDIDVLPGTPLAGVYSLDDIIIDIENKMFTHRPDCFGILGVAREIAGIQQQSFTSPGWYLEAGNVVPAAAGLPLEVKNEASELVPRFMAITIADVEVGPSSPMVQSYLSRVGLKPINNVVDITNLVMVLTGQPLHAYDYDKVADKSHGVPKLIARLARKQEGLSLLNGKRVEVDDPAIVIATDQEVIGMGGIMGGTDTEVGSSTKRVILECANFDMYSIRRTSMKYGLFTDAVTRFNKGQSSLQNDKVIAYAARAICDVAKGGIAGKIYDLHETLRSPTLVRLTPTFINERLGLELSSSDITKLLKNVEFEVESAEDDLIVSAPFWRTDIEIPEDIVEEVGRLHGYDHLPLTLPTRTIQPVARDPMLQLKSAIRSILTKGGANELVTYSFVHGNLLEKVGQDSRLAFQLSNALSPDLQYFRLSLSPSLLDKVHANIKAGFSEFALFEMNKVHSKHEPKDDEDLPKEFSVLSLVFAANDKQASQYNGAPFYQAKKYLEYIAQNLGITLVYQPMVKDLPHQVTKPYDPKRTALVTIAGSKDVLGIVGEFKSSVKQALKLPAYCAGFEISLDDIVNSGIQPLRYTKLSRFPATEQDISFKVSAATTYAELAAVMQKVLAQAQKERGYAASLQPLDVYQPDHQKDKHMTFRIMLLHYARTLTTDEANKLLDQVAAKVQAELNATRL